MARRFLVPAAGLAIINPMTMRPLPAGGAWVNDDTYWRRRRRDGDCAEALPADVVAAEPDPGPAPLTDSSMED